MVARPGPDIARLGGDEFTVMLPLIQDEKAAARIAERVQTLINAPFHLDGHEIYVTASVGVAIYPDDGEDAAALLKHADTAMYHAKASGKNNWQFYKPSFSSGAVERLTLETEMRGAIERGEFCLHFQPQISAATHALCSLEALVRWNHPRRGQVPAGEFIPIAEESGLIIPLGAWVLRQACLQVKAWEAAGLGRLQVAVNLSGHQLRQKRFVESVLALLEETGMDPSMLELELTETVLMDSRDAAIARLQPLRDAGVHISVDDFGTGYSSLGYLNRLPISTLKVDRSFVAGLPDRPDNAAITTAIISMARSLGMEVVAEGVETPEQVRFLTEAGCDRLQGYLLGRPVPAAEIERVLRLRADGVACAA
jgi:predicted signal transduction protein with EAL and GGDEF domain